MPSHIHQDTNKLIAALEEARRYLPPQPERLIRSEPALSIDVPTGLPSGMGKTHYDFVGQNRMEQASAHQKMALAICENSARKALASITTRIHALPACTTWKPKLAVAMDEHGKTSLWVDATSIGQAVARSVPPAQLRTHLHALAFALRFCSPIDGTRRWSFNNERFFYPAQNPVDAILLGVALFNPNAVRTICKGGSVHADIAERFSTHTLLDALRTRMNTLLPQYTPKTSDP